VVFSEGCLWVAFSSCTLEIPLYFLSFSSLHLFNLWTL
jgi:hypothetical protein